MNYTLKQLEQIAKNEQISLSHHFRKHELIEILNNYYNSSSVDKLKFYTKDKLLQIVKDNNLEDNLNQIVKERNLIHYYQILKDELLNYLIEHFSEL